MWDVGSYPGVVLPCRALGVMHVEQNRRNHDPSERIRNDRILAVPEAARREQDITSIASLPARVRAELEHLTVIATGLAGKDVRIVGWGDAAAALKLIRDATSATAL